MPQGLPHNTKRLIGFDQSQLQNKPAPVLSRIPVRGKSDLKAEHSVNHVNVPTSTNPHTCFV